MIESLLFKKQNAKYEFQIVKTLIFFFKIFWFQFYVKIYRNKCHRTKKSQRFRYVLLKKNDSFFEKFINNTCKKIKKQFVFSSIVQFFSRIVEIATTIFQNKIYRETFETIRNNKSNTSIEIDKFNSLMKKKMKIFAKLNAKFRAIANNFNFAMFELYVVWNFSILIDLICVKLFEKRIYLYKILIIIFDIAKRIDFFEYLSSNDLMFDRRFV